MKDKIVSGNGEVYVRVNKTSARKSFNNGERVYVMARDRNPITSLTSPHVYYIGSKPYSQLGKGSIQWFEDLLEDFGNWLMFDGYGHTPDYFRAKRELFSYWLKVE